MRLRCCLLVLALTLVAACGDDDAPAPDGGVGLDGGASLDAGTPRDAHPLPDAPRGRPDDDGNRDFEDALPIEIGGGAVSGDITSGDDYDYVRFDATEGQYLAVLQLADGSFFTPGITLLDPDRRPITQASDVNGCSGVEGASRELLTRAARTGTYYVEVSNDFFARGGGGEPSPWSVRVVDLATASPSLIVGEGATARLRATHRCVLGAFESAGDVDELEIDLPPYRALDAYDPGRHGSTGGASAIEQVAEGGAVLGRGTDALLLGDVPASRVRLRGPVIAGANDHYVLRQRPPTPSSPPVEVFFVERDSPSNDTRASAELLPAPPVDEGGYPAPFVLSLPPGDVDHLALEVAGTAELSIDCTAARYGSSVRDLEVRLLADDGSTRVAGRETTTGPARFRATLAPGTHVLRFSAPTHVPDIAGHLVVCAVSVSGR